MPIIGRKETGETSNAKFGEPSGRREDSETNS